MLECLKYFQSKLDVGKIARGLLMSPDSDRDQERPSSEDLVEAIKHLTNAKEDEFVAVLSDHQKFTNVYTNTETSKVETTTDKLQIILMEFRKSILRKHLWRTSLPTTLTLFSVLGTTQKFQSLGPISPETIETIFWALFCVSALWLIFSVFRLCQYHQRTKIKTIINQIGGIH